jgi:hypothetical protein
VPNNRSQNVPIQPRPDVTSVRVDLTRAEIELLGQISHFYERNFGPFRHIVRLTASSDIRKKYRFMADESAWLAECAASLKDSIRESGREPAEIQLTSSAIIAFWGRILASLHSRRARRKLSASAVAAREQLAQKLCLAAKHLLPRSANKLESDLRTRRPIEAAWMRVQLELPPEPF